MYVTALFIWLRPHPNPSPKERDKKIMEKIILLVG